MPPSLVSTIPKLVPTVNDELFNAGVRRALWLEGMKKYQADRLIRFLHKEVWNDVVNQLEKRLPNITTATAKRLQALLTETDGLISGGIRAGSKSLRADLGRLALSESEWTRRVLESGLPVSIGTSGPALRVLSAAIDSKPLQGRLLKDWYEDLSAHTQRSLAQQINIGLAQGESVQQMVRRIRGTKALNYTDGVLSTSSRHAATIARTATTHATTHARELTYEANKDIVKGVQFVATLDARTTDICASLDGKVYGIKEGPRPPMHHQCRSTTVPVVKSWKEMGLKAPPPSTRASMNGQVSARMTYPRWLKKQPKRVQEMALGKKKAALFRAGKVKIEQFVGPTGRTLTLKELESKLTQVFPAVPSPGLSSVDNINKAFLDLESNTLTALKAKWKSGDLTYSEFQLREYVHRTANAKLKGKPLGKLSQEWYDKLDPNARSYFDQRAVAYKPVSKGKPKTKGVVSTVAPKKAPPPPPTPAPAPPPTTTPGGLIQYDELESAYTKIGAKPGGSNPGYLARDSAGDNWLIKFPANDEIARNEVLAGKFYKAAGADVAETRLIRSADGRLGVASRMEPGLKVNSAKLQSGTVPSEVADYFATDAFLANWDTVGLTYDNLLMKANGKFFRIDAGGALRFRAQGAPKGTAFGKTVGEIDTLRTKGTAGKVFGQLTDEQIAASMQRTIDALDDATIEVLVRKYGPTKAYDRLTLINTLKARRQDLIKRHKMLKTKIGTPKPIPSPVKPTAPTPAPPKPPTPTPSPHTGPGGEMVGDWIKTKYGKVKYQIKDIKPSSTPGKVYYKLEGTNGSYKIEFSPEKYHKIKTPTAQPVLAGPDSIVSTGAPTEVIESTAASYQAWTASLSDSEKRAIKARSLTSYKSIRKRQTAFKTATSKPKTQQVKSFTAATARAPRHQGDIYRGVPKVPRTFDRKLPQEGFEFTITSSESWSTNPGVAKAFGGGGPEATMIVIRDSRYGTKITQLSAHKNEVEVLANPGTRLRVVKVYKRGKHSRFKNMNVIELEEVSYTSPLQVKPTVKVPKTAPLSERLAATKTFKNTTLDLGDDLAVQASTQQLIVQELSKHAKFFDDLTEGYLAKVGASKAKFLPKIKTVKVAQLTGKHADAFVTTSFNPVTKEIELIFNAKHFSGDIALLKSKLKALHREGWLATDSIHGLIRHEMGHVFEQWAKQIRITVSEGFDVRHTTLYDRIQEVIKDVKRGDLGKWDTAKHLSQYAAENEYEFFAEMYAKLTQVQVMPASEIGEPLYHLKAVITATLNNNNLATGMFGKMI